MKVERLKEIPLTNAELAKIRSPHPYKAHETLRLLATIDARDSEIERLSKIEERAKEQMAHHQNYGDDLPKQTAYWTAKWILEGGKDG